MARSLKKGPFADESLLKKVDKYTVVGKVVHGIDGVNMSYCAFVVGFGNTSNLYLGPKFWVYHDC